MKAFEFVVKAYLWGIGVASLSTNPKCYPKKTNEEVQKLLRGTGLKSIFDDRETCYMCLSFPEEHYSCVSNISLSYDDSAEIAILVDTAFYYQPRTIFYFNKNLNYYLKAEIIIDRKDKGYYGSVSERYDNETINHHNLPIGYRNQEKAIFIFTFKVLSNSTVLVGIRARFKDFKNPGLKCSFNAFHPKKLYGNYAIRFCYNYPSTYNDNFDKNLKKFSSHPVMLPCELGGSPFTPTKGSNAQEGSKDVALIPPLSNERDDNIVEVPIPPFKSTLSKNISIGGVFFVPRNPLDPPTNLTAVMKALPKGSIDNSYFEDGGIKGLNKYILPLENGTQIDIGPYKIDSKAMKEKEDKKTAVTEGVTDLNGGSSNVMVELHLIWFLLLAKYVITKFQKLNNLS